MHAHGSAKQAMDSGSQDLTNYPTKFPGYFEFVSS